MAAQLPPAELEALKAAFNNFDKDKDGKLSKADIEATIKEMGGTRGRTLPSWPRRTPTTLSSTSSSRW